MQLLSKQLPFAIMVGYHFVSLILSIQVQYGQLLASFSLVDSVPIKKTVLVHKLSELGTKNDQDCELLELESRTIELDPTKIIKKVSIIHDCTSTCKYSSNATFTIERELTTSNKKLTLEHDLLRNVYCLNPYSMV